jgi:hypothetical protein
MIVPITESPHFLSQSPPISSGLLRSVLFLSIHWHECKRNGTTSRDQVNLKITLKKEYSEIQSGRITQGFNLKIVLSFQVFISRVSRVLLLSFQAVFITLKKFLVYRHHSRSL